MELSATGKVILGMLAAKPRSGYEIKQLVDSSARFFWAASYGQIYPELKRLEKAGLITGADSSQGARQRTVFKLTADGQEGRSGLDRERRPRSSRCGTRGCSSSSSPARSSRLAPPRSRASALPPRAPRRPSFARSRRRWIEAGRPDGPEAEPDAGSLTVLRYGIEMSEWAAEWFERAAEDLENDNGRRDRPAQQGGRHVQRTRIARTASRQAHGDLRGGLLRHRRRARRRRRQQAGSVRRRRPGDRERQGRPTAWRRTATATRA